MHIYLLAETFGEDHKLFREWLRSLSMKRSDEEKARLIRGGMADPNPELIDDAHPIVREVRLYDVVIPEDNKDEFMSVLRGFQSQPVENVDTLRSGANVMQKDIGVGDDSRLKRFGAYLVGKCFPKIDKVDMGKYDPHPHVKWDKWAYCAVLGTQKDKRNKDNIEMT